MLNRSHSNKSDVRLSTKKSISFDINSSSDMQLKSFGVELFSLLGGFWSASTIFLLVSHETFPSKKDKAHTSGEMYQKLPVLMHCSFRY